MKKNLFTILILFIVLSCILLVGSAQDKVIEMKIGVNQPEGTAESLGIAKFIELAEEKSEGKLKIIPYYSNMLGTPKTQLENVMSGTQDMYVESYTYYQPYVEGMRIHSLPYVFRDNDHYKKFLKSDLEKELEAELLEKTGIRVLNTERNWLSGPYRVLFATRPIKSLEDIKGLRMRIPDSITQVKVWSALGASTTVIPWNDIYTSLKQGLISAATCQLSQLYANSFTEVAKHVTITHEYPQQLAISINNEVFENLPQDLQAALTNAANEAGNYHTGLIIKAGEEVIQKCISEYGAVFYEIDLQPWREKLLALHEDLVAEGFIDGDLLSSAKSIE